jgi:hypothetical protein
MKDFFRVMGKAFAVVFGSMSALALVLVLLALAARPVLRSWQQTRGIPAKTQVANTAVASQEQPTTPGCTGWDAQGQCIEDRWTKYVEVSLRSCDKKSCSVYNGETQVGTISLEEIVKARQRMGEFGVTPVNK